MKFKVNYQKIQEFEIKELNIDFESSEKTNQTIQPQVSPKLWR
jgi:hypothetical protein